MKNSLGIIGGADGPTAIFVTTSFSWELLLLIVLAVGIIIGLILHKRKKK